MTHPSDGPLSARSNAPVRQDPLVAWVGGLVAIVVLLVLPRPLVRAARRFVFRIVLEALAIVTMGLLTGRAAEALSDVGDEHRPGR